MTLLPNWIRSSVGRQIIAATVSVLAAVSLLSGWYEVTAQREALHRQTEQQGRLLARTAAILSVEPLLEANYPALNTFVEELTDQEDRAVYARIERADGKIVAQAGGGKPVDGRWIQEVRVPVHAPRVGNAPGELLGHTVLGISTQQAAAAIASSQRALLLQALGTFTLLALMLSWILGRLLHRPLLSLAAQAERLGDGELDQVISWDKADEFGRLAETLETMRTRLVSSYREIQDQNERLRELDQLKSSFLATVSHEMRTPMNGIIGFAELLADAHLDDEQQSMAETVLGSARVLLRIIDDILDLSRIEAGRIPLDNTGFDPHHIVAQVMALLAPEARNRGLAFSWDMEPGVPRCLYGDPLRLRQVITNLLGNAIKFTEEGGVTLRAGIVTRSDTSLTLRIEVEDTGIGIGEEAQSRLFQAFSQVDASTTRKYGGTGLGLAISRRLVELMGGRIGVDSQPGRGSRFWLEVPFMRCEPVAPGPSCPEAPETSMIVHQAAQDGPSRLLLVEDNPINQKLLVRVLAKLGFDVEVAENGQEGVEAVQRAAHPFAAVLMDCQMPVMDGYTATRVIRALDGPAAGTPIIALTAHAMKGDREKCLAAGMDDYVTKPVSLAELRKALEARIPTLAAR